MTQDNGLIRLDFGEYGSVEVPPAVAEAFVSNQRIRDRIRVESVRARRIMRETAKQDNSHDALCVSSK